MRLTLCVCVRLGLSKHGTERLLKQHLAFLQYFRRLGESQRRSAYSTEDLIAVPVFIVSACLLALMSQCAMSPVTSLPATRTHTHAYKILSVIPNLAPAVIIRT